MSPDSPSRRTEEAAPPPPVDDGPPAVDGSGATSTGAPVRHAVLLMTASSFLVPAAGVLTQPLLAQALGVGGRGELAAAMAPHLLAVAVATLGLPEALTYYVAKHPRITRRALLWSLPLCAALSAVCVVATVAALPFLSAGDAELAGLILVGVGLTLPALAVGLLQGAAAGRQMWTAVAAQRLVNVVLRVVAFVVLLVSGHLTVLTALLVSTLAPIVAGLVYWRLFLPPPRDPTEPALPGPMVRLLVSYGNRVWFGSIISMLLSRLDQVLMAPLSTVEDVGLYSVALTISDVPLIVALGIAGALFGVNSKERNADNIVVASRLTILLGGAGCVVLGATLPWWIGPLFGPEFRAAVVPTQMLLVSALVCMPGLMAATSLGAWGRPGLRSAGLALALVVNVSVFVLLVPRMGVVGACWTNIISNTVLTAYTIVVAARLMGVRVRDFVLVRAADVAQVRHELRRLVSRLTRRAARTDV